MSANFTPEQKEYKDYKSFGTFKMFVLQNFPFLAEDFDAMTYYQMLCKIVEHLKVVIENNENIQENQSGLVDAYNQLQNYVNTYFDSLDIQTEINEKLEEMSSNGQLAEITAMFLNNVTFRVFKNVEELKNASLKAGQFVETLGYYNQNDGGNAKYVVVAGDYSESANYDVIELKNGLFAKMISKYFNSKINVKSFGAKGDGISDDYNAIQKCIFYCADNGLITFIPNGNYLISSQLITAVSDEDERVNNIFVIEGESSLTKINKYGDIDGFSIFNFLYVNNLFISNIHSETLSSTLIPNDVYVKGFDYWSKSLKKKHFEFTNFFGTGEGYQKLICLPAPTKAGRYGDGLYDNYPLRINNNSGYNAIEIENFGYNQEDDTSIPADNSAIGIIDNVTNSTGVIFIDSKGDRSFERYVRSVEAIQSAIRPGTVWEIAKNGHIAIGCSTDYNDEVAKSVSCIKLRDNSPEIMFFDAKQNNKSTALRMYKDGNGNKTFGIIIDGDYAMKFINKWRNNSKVVCGVQKVRIMVRDTATDTLSFYIENNDDQSQDKELVLSPTQSGNLRFGSADVSISERSRVQLVHASETWFRPTLTSHWRDIGYMFFDTDLGKPIWWNGTKWVDANGNAV